MPEFECELSEFIKVVYKTKSFETETKEESKAIMKKLYNNNELEVNYKDVENTEIFCCQCNVPD